ncbi:hypothetical protein KSF73_09495 [Burkholderiaceae bacterium DAT-1]|nr:hypothetical protein [Burkholderiaceae bacterium DAT-1]
MSELLLTEDQERPLRNIALIAYAGLGISLVTALPTGLLAAVLLYVKQDDARGTWLESHFRWGLKVFWTGVISAFMAFIFGVTIIGIPVAILIAIVAWIWVAFAVVRGALALNDKKEIRW